MDSEEDIEEPTKPPVIISKKKKNTTVTPKPKPKKKKKKTKKRSKTKKSKKSKKRNTKSAKRKTKQSKKNIKANINFLGRRLIKEGIELDVRDTQIEIAIWDGQDMDGDTVSLYYNGDGRREDC